MANKVPKSELIPLEDLIPVAERIIEFDEDDFIEDTVIVSKPESDFDDEDLELFSKQALVLINGRNIMQYAEEFPIVHYQCTEQSQHELADYRLNAFIECITVSTALQGKRFSIDSGRMESEIEDWDTIVYYRDRHGIDHSVLQYDICKFLLKKPKLVVSPEGVLIFFTKDCILATVDCNQYCWLDRCEGIDIPDKMFIKDIEVVGNEYCKVILTDGKKKEPTVQELKLTFSFDISKRHMIKVTVEKLYDF